MNLADRLLAKVSMVPESGCWIFSGSWDGKGYGMIAVRTGLTQRAHRVSWELTNGAIKQGQQVLHKCDTPQCVNPEHLFLGDNTTNVADKMRKGRQAKGDQIAIKMRGENQGGAKLTEADVLAIRKAKGTATLKTLSTIYNVSQSVLCEVQSGKAWAHVRGTT